VNSGSRWLQAAELAMATAATLASKPAAKPATHAPAPKVAAPKVEAPAHAAKSTAPALPAFARPAPAPTQPTVAGGQPLDSAARQTFEARFQRDFSNVRIFPDSKAKVENLVPLARAATVGNNIYFSSGEYAPNTSEGRNLLAHELTHTIQQSGAKGRSDDRVGSVDDAFEEEARANAVAALEGGPIAVRQQVPQRGPQPDEESHGFWYNRVVNRFPWIKPILDRGITGWIEDRVSEAFEAVVDFVLKPVRAVQGAVSSIWKHVQQLVDWIKKAAASIAKGDCSVLHEAVDYVEKVVGGIVSPIFERIRDIGKKIGDFFTGLWERFGAPIWGALKRFAGKVWQVITDIADWIWSKTEWIRKWLGRAWRWIKNKLGIGEGEEGQNGLLQWVEGKVEKAWNWIKEKAEPIKKPLMVLGGILVMLSPAGPVIAIGLAIGGVIEGVRAIKRYFGTRTGVVSARQILQTVVLPKLISVIRGFAGLLAGTARGMVGALRRARDVVRNAAGAAAQTIFSFLAGMLDWVADRLDDFVKWGEQAVLEFVSWIERVVAGLGAFLNRILDFLEHVAQVVKDIFKITYLLMSKIWNLIPACIRDPFIDFLGMQILGRIPIFRTIAGTPEAWAKTKAEVGAIIKQIFVDFDLTGAMKRTFKLLLRVLDVPLELLEAVFGKLVQAWDVIKEKPVEFLKNLFHTMMLALKNFFKNILKHLANGIVGWLTASLEGANLYWPQSWTSPSEIFGFVASILGISVNHVIDRVALKYPAVAAGLRRAISIATGAWEWISLIVQGKWTELWEKIKEKITNLRDMLIQAVVDWLMKEVIEGVMLQLLTTADPTGISEVVMFIIDLYRTIKTVVQYMRRILVMLNTMLDSILGIAAGVIAPAAELIEDAMDKGMPVVIGFLANLIGLGDVGTRIKEALTTIREKVDEGIDWLIEKAASVIKAVAGAVKSVVGMIFPEKKFAIAEEGHTVSAEGSGETHEIYVQSDKMAINAFITYARQNGAGVPNLESDLAILKAKYDTWRALPEKEQKEQEDKVKKFDDIAELIEKIMKNLPLVKPIDSVITAGPLFAPDGLEVGANWMEADPLTSKHPPGASPGSTDWDVWSIVKPGRKGTSTGLRRQGTGLYVRGHLLNQKLGGGNAKENLTPITYTANSNHEQFVESLLKDLIGESGAGGATRKGMAYYKVEADYSGVPRKISNDDDKKGVVEEEGYLASGLKTTWYQLVPNPNDPTKPVQAGPQHNFFVKNVPPYPKV